MNDLEKLVEFIAKKLVDKPEDVNISLLTAERTTVIELSVSKDDLGKIIGKEGKTAKAIRTILNAASAKINKRVVLEIVE